MNYFEVDNLKKVFLDYFVNNCGHTQISGASLVPTTDDSVLFTPAGMHPLIPYLAGKEKHPCGNKLVNIQNVVRTGAINRVEEDSLLTFFELFGSWVIGDYSKEICGGPHAKSTGELKNFKILKEQSSSAKVRRIKAVVDYK